MKIIYVVPLLIKLCDSLNGSWKTFRLKDREGNLEKKSKSHWNNDNRKIDLSWLISSQYFVAK